MSSDRAGGKPWRDAAAPAGQRAEALAGAMTLDEKVSIALGNFETVAHLGSRPFGTPTARTASADRTP